MPDPHATILALLEEKKIPHQVRENEFIWIAYATDQLRFEASIKATPWLIRVVGYLPMRVAPEHRLAVAELLTRMNVLVNIGSYQMWMETGDVIYDAMIPTIPDTLGTEEVRKLFQLAFDQVASHLSDAWDLVARVGTGAVQPLAAMQILYERIARGSSAGEIADDLLKTESLMVN